MSKCRLIVFSDIHYLDERPNKLDFNLSRKLTQYSLEIIEKLINIINKRKPDVSICLGDLIEDTFNHDKDIMNYTYIWNILKKINIPFYSVIGNHDHEEYFSDNKKSELVYKEFFGPNYYAFNIGRDYYIVVDNIDYHGNRRYTERITKDQLDWVRKYTEYIPKGSQVFVAMHAPAYIYYLPERILEGADELMDILKD